MSDDDGCPHRICIGDEHGMRCTECGALLTLDVVDEPEVPAP